MSLSGRIGTSTAKIYKYDAFNRLVQFNEGATEATYTYGADNLRNSKTVNNIRTDFGWNGQNLASEKKNDITTAYTYDPTGIVMSNDGTDTVRFIKDPHGNVVATSKNDKIVDSYDYTAFGVQLNSVETSNPFRYCGEYYDEELDSIYLRNRYYQPTTGRFINEDPIKDGLNWYSYCGGNPVMMIDPSGLGKVDLESIENYSGGAEKYLECLEGYLNEISDYTVSIDKTSGEIKIVSCYGIVDKPCGSELVGNLIGNDNITICYKENEASTYGYEKDGPITIKFDPEKVLDEKEWNYVMDSNGMVYLEEDPDRAILFAHELGHANDIMLGNYETDAKLRNTNVTSFYFDSNGHINLCTTDLCEIRNIGLPYISDNNTLIYNPYVQITENDIRREMGSGTLRLTGGNPNKK